MSYLRENKDIYAKFVEAINVSNQLLHWDLLFVENVDINSSAVMVVGKMSVIDGFAISCPRTSLSCSSAPVVAVSKSPRRKKGTHQQSGEGLWSSPDSWRPGGQIAMLPIGQEDPNMEHTYRNPDGQDAVTLGKSIALGFVVGVRSE